MEVASGQRAENVAVIVLNGFSPFELGVVCEVFGVDRTDEGLPAYDFAVVAGEPGPLRSETGFVLQTEFGLDRLETADLIAVPAVSDVGPRCRTAGFPEPLLAALRQGVERGARVLSVCNGAFVLAAAGLMDDRRCTTHWRQADLLARFCPAAKVDPSVLYVDDDPVITSAGRPPASTPASTWCAGSRAAGWPAPSLAGWWCHRIATAGRPSTWSGRSLTRRPIR